MTAPVLLQPKPPKHTQHTSRTDSKENIRKWMNMAYYDILYTTHVAFVGLLRQSVLFSSFALTDARLKQPLWDHLFDSN